MPDIYVLDAGAMFSTWSQRITSGRFLTTPSVIAEIVNRPSRQRADYMTVLRSLREERPSKESVSLVTSAARETGDLPVLSKTDIELVALAYEMSRAGHDVAVVSTDLAMLNTASHLTISVIDPKKRFRRRIRWKQRCHACGHITSSFDAGTECPVCGTEMKRVPSGDT